jgi:acyl-CoA synthetase (NDP forming)
VRNPVDTIALFDPAMLEKTLRVVGEAENIDAVMFHTSFRGGVGGRTSAMLGGLEPAQYIEMVVDKMQSAREAVGAPIVVVLRPPLDQDSMQRATAFQEQAWRVGFPVFPTIPRAANALARALRWRRPREDAA